MQVKLSVIIPVRNEEKYIEQCIESLLKQDFPLHNHEVIFVDGMSEDRTKEIILNYQNYYDFIKVLSNPDKTVPYAMNIGIKNSNGNIIIRMDAHSEYYPDYISKSLLALKETGADVVGGLAITKGKGIIGQAIAQLLSSSFGVGNSKFRTFGKSGYVDTVPFGTFKRETFDEYGLYDVRLTRSQDNELNSRIRMNGGKVYLSNDIKFIYYCRNTTKGLIKYGFTNGKWVMITSYLKPKSKSLRHFTPLLFVLSLIVGITLLFFKIKIINLLFLSEIALYLLLVFLFSIKGAKGNFIRFLLLLFFYPLFHITYGMGSIYGLLIRRKYKGNCRHPKGCDCFKLI